MCKSILLFVLFVFLGGCAALKKRQDTPIVSKEVNLKFSFDQALSSGDFVEGEWPDWNFWTLFEDEQLTAFVNLAIQENPDLKAAAMRVRSSDQEARKVFSKFIPNFGASFRDNYEHLSKDDLDRFPPSKVPAVINQVNLQLNFDYEIDLFGKNREAYRAAVGEARAQKAEMAQSYLMITVALCKTYFDYEAMLLQIETEEEVLKAQITLTELIRARVLNKLDDEIALEKQQAKLLEVRRVLTDLEKELALSKSQIKILMGLSPDDDLTFERPTAEFNRPFPVPENLPLNLLVRRPDLMMHIWKVESAAHLVGVARASFFPNINLSSFVGLATLSWGNLFSSNSFSGAITPAVNLPLFTGGRLTANLNQSFANFDAAVLDYNALVLQAAKEVSDGIKVLQASNLEVNFQKEAVLSLKKATDLTYARFQSGVSNYLEVLETTLEELSQSSREITMQNKKHLAVLSLIRALGGGYVQEKVEVKNP